MRTFAAAISIASASSLMLCSGVVRAQEQAPDAAGFSKQVQPFLRDLCIDCHDGTKPKGDFLLEGIDGNLVAGPDIEKWVKVLDQLTLSQMPPDEETQPGEDERLAMIDWIRAELLKGGLDPEDKLARPDSGNYVNHDRLFGDEDFGPAFSPARMWRIRPVVYETGIRAVAKDGRFVRPFTLSSGGHGFKDYDNQYVLAGADLNQLMSNARVAARYLTATEGEGEKAERAKSTPEEIYALSFGSGEPNDSEIDVVIDWLFPRVLLRDANDDERERLRQFARLSITSDGRLLGTRNLISAILLTPEGLYRSERGGGEEDAHGRVRLTPRETAFAIAFALTDDRPDSALLKAADAGELADAAGVRAQVERILEDDKIDKPRILAFFREYFEYDKAVDVFKDEDLNRAHFPETLVADTDRLVMHLYEKDEDVLRNLLTTPKSFIYYSEDKGEPVEARAKNPGGHTSYSLPTDWKWIPDQPIDLRPEHRAGILTQPAWLVAMSGNFDNHAIWRGLWIRKKLLGGTIPDIPIGVDAQLPEDPEKTLRERMEVTREDYCWKCHQKMDPLGLPFEMFDHFGRWRTKELAKPVDTSGEVIKAGDPKIEGEIDDAVNFLHRLADSERVRQVFIRHVFRYFMGRNETLTDAATLRAADKAYVESGGSMKALIESILTSDSFLYRKSL